MKFNLSLALAALLGWGAAAWLFSRPSPKPEVKEKIVIQERVVTQEAKVVTKTIKPDGTTIVKEETKTLTETAKKAQQTVQVKPQLSKYSLGVSAIVQPARALEIESYQIMGGMRLWQSPVWVNLGVQIPRTQPLREGALLLGVTLEF